MNSEPSPGSPSTPVVNLLYLSRALAAWGDRTWQFVGAMFLLQLDDSLQLVALYGLVSCLALMLLGPALGRLVDFMPRDKMMMATIITQNTVISLTCAIMALYFSEIFLVTQNLTFWVSVIVLILSPLSFLSSMTGKISIERDWVVCMCGGDTSKMAMVNTNLRTIDLVCNLLAPTLAGQILTFCSYFVAATILIFWVLVSATIELLLLRQTFKKNAVLKIKVSRENQASPSWTAKVASVFAGWKTYYSHPVREAGLGLALLYMTVLDFGTITWGYCTHQGVSESLLGGLTAVSALVGGLSTRLFPLLLRRLGLTSTGLLGFSLQSSCLILCLASLWAPGSPFSLTKTSLQESEEPSYISVILLLTGMISSRFGLYLADISVHQVFQEEVQEKYRGTVSGVQTSLQSVMDLVKFTLVVLIPHQSHFGILIILSFVSISSGGLFFLKYKLQKTKEESKNDSLEQEVVAINI